LHSSENYFGHDLNLTMSRSTFSKNAGGFMMRVACDRMRVHAFFDDHDGSWVWAMTAVDGCCLFRMWLLRY